MSNYVSTGKAAPLLQAMKKGAQGFRTVFIATVGRSTISIQKYTKHSHVKKANALEVLSVHSTIPVEIKESLLVKSNDKA